jgi:hypothetical protein
MCAAAARHPWSLAKAPSKPALAGVVQSSDTPYTRCSRLKTAGSERMHITAIVHTSPSSALTGIQVQLGTIPTCATELALRLMDTQGRLLLAAALTQQTSEQDKQQKHV